MKKLLSVLFVFAFVIVNGQTKNNVFDSGGLTINVDSFPSTNLPNKFFFPTRSHYYYDGINEKGTKVIQHIIDSVNISDSDKIGIGTMTFVTPQPRKFKQFIDTVSMILLLSDTANYEWNKPDVAISDPVVRAFMERHTVVFIKGYAVRKVTVNARGMYQDGDYMYFNDKDIYSYDIQYYLDEFKTALPKNIKVWMGESN